ncbi:MAG TPA: peptide deformylase [Clostridiales bacterium]|nr:peptide deformylase [Clostridiales bacterium]
MSVREIIQEGNIILRLKADKIEIFDKNLHALLDDMHETMISANGIGLAAPQIGISKRVIVVSTNEDEKIEIVNPEIVKFSGMQIGQEGCLSVDSSKNGNVKRPSKITVKGFDRNGKKILIRAKDLTARALCHEIDHLNGILFIDKLEPATE